MNAWPRRSEEADFFHPEPVEERSILSALPTAPGAYRWYYADAACGEYTAVAIFMVGAVFSPRYVVGAARGALPSHHCPVNFALYRSSNRIAWAFTEYCGDSAGDCDSNVLRIGRSELRIEDDGRISIEIDEVEAPFGSRPVSAQLQLRPASVASEPLALDLVHAWQPLIPRADALLRIGDSKDEHRGHGYLDTNHGESPLGIGLPGWSWSRVHRPAETVIDYLLPGPRSLRVTADASQTRVTPIPTPERTLRTTWWGLSVPRVTEPTTTPRLLESSPFYARYEATSHGAHVLGEVADFRRFRSPLIRWMAHFRSRQEVLR